MYEIIKNRFEELKGIDGYKRIDENHPLDIYVGINEMNKKSLTIILDGKIVKLESTKMITIQIYERKDGKINISFNLQENYMADVFYKFCDDIIESTRNFERYNIEDFIIERWNRWIQLFTKARNFLLSENEIRGLLGELIFLKEEMFVRYGIDKSIISWQGCENAHKDFEIGETWYEIKTIRQNGNSIVISSIEQLDAMDEGKLVTVKLENGNTEISNYITLNNYVSSIENMINNNEIKTLFLSKLNTIGYRNDAEYDTYVYTIKGVDFYVVDNKFPRLKKEELKDGIGKVSYEVYLNSIKNLKVNVE